MTDDSKNDRTKWGLLAIPLMAVAVLVLVLTFGHGGAERARATDDKPECPIGGNNAAGNGPVNGPIDSQCEQFTFSGSMVVNAATIGLTDATCTLIGSYSSAPDPVVDKQPVVGQRVVASTGGADLEQRTAKIYFIKGEIDCPTGNPPAPFEQDPQLQSSTICKEQEWDRTLNPGVLDPPVTCFVTLRILVHTLPPPDKLGDLTGTLGMNCKVEFSFDEFSCIMDVGSAPFGTLAEVKSGSLAIVQEPAVAVGGLAVDLNPTGSGGNAGLLAGIIAGATAAAIALGGAAWYARRRWLA